MTVRKGGRDEFLAVGEGLVEVTVNACPFSRIWL